MITLFVQWVSHLLLHPSSKRNLYHDSCMCCVQLGRLFDLQWKLGVAVSSSNCSNLSAPFVALSYKISDSNGKARGYAMELSYSEFQVNKRVCCFDNCWLDTSSSHLIIIVIVAYLTVFTTHPSCYCFTGVFDKDERNCWAYGQLINHATDIPHVWQQTVGPSQQLLITSRVCCVIYAQPLPYNSLLNIAVAVFLFDSVELSVIESM
jgi:hypothetical protein